MNRLLMITVAVLAFAGQAGAGNLFDEAGNHIGTSVDRGHRIEITYDDGTKATDAFYVLDGKIVSVFTFPDGSVEMRPVAQPADHNTGLIFNGEYQEGQMFGDARLDRRGCREWFKAFIDEGKNDTLVLRAFQHSAKCKATLRPVTTVRTLGR